MIRSSFSIVSNLQKNILVVLALAGLWCFFLWNAFGADRSFAMYMDNEFFIGTVLSSMSETLRSGDWPLRMDTILGGIPLYNFAQLSPFYPFYFTILPIYSNPQEVVYSMHWITLGHILIMEVNMYIFLRVIGSSRLAAITGAALFAFSANSLSYAVWMNIIAPYSWFPLYLAGLVGILKFPRSMIYSFMALGGVVLLTLASPAQPLIHAVVVTGVFVFAYCFSKWRTGELGVAPYAIGRLVVVGVLALFLVAPVLLPTVLEFKNMIRWIGPFPAVMGNAAIPFEAFLIDQLSIVDLGGVFFKFKGASVGHQFAGVLVIALASVAIVSRHWSWIIVAIAFVLFYSIISSTGSNLGLAYLNYNVPILNKVREPSRFLVLFQFAVATLAVIGIDELRKLVLQSEVVANSKRQLIALIVTALASLLILLAVSDQIISIVSPFISVIVLVGFVIITWLAALSSFRGRGLFITAMWSIGALVMLSIEVPWVPPTVSGSQYHSTKSLALDMAIERVSTLDPHHEYRVIFEGKIDKQKAAMLASYKGVRTLNSYFNPAPRRQFQELYYHGARADNYFRILGAKYLICNECSVESLQAYSYLESVAGFDIYEAEAVLPHSFIVHESNGEFLNLADFVTKAASIELSKNLLFVEPNMTDELSKFSNTGRVDCISREEARTDNYSQFSIQCKSDGVMVLNKFFDDSWSVFVDGAKSSLLRVNGNQMGVQFTAGSHMIEFRYLPVTFLISLGLLLVGVVFIFYLVITKNFVGVRTE